MKTPRIFAVTTLVFALVFTSPVAAHQERVDGASDSSTTVESETEQSSTISNFSLTLSTLNLAKPVLSDEDTEYGPELEIMGEVSLTDDFGAAVLLGYGPATGLELPEPYDIDLFRIGLQGVWYALGDFNDGMQLGLQLLHRRGFSDAEVEDIALGGTVNALDVSAFVGYKVVSDIGLTFAGQVGGGIQMLAAQGEAEANGATATAEESDIAPAILFNLNLGWSL